MPSKIEISYKTILFTVFFLILLWFLVQIKEILFLVFISFIIMSALKPWVEALQKVHIPRVLAIFFVYIIGISVIIYAGSTIIPPLIAQSITLSQSLPKFLKTVLPFFTIDTQFFTQQITPIGENLVKFTLGIFSNIFTIFTVFVVSFYLLIERQQLENHLSSFMGKEGANKFLTILKRVEERLGSWVRGQLTLGLIIGFSTYLGLMLLNIPFILPLSIIAGILEIIPIIGPIISAIPAVLVALTVSPFLAVATIALFIIIQQSENHLVVPMVIRKTVGIPPVITIITLMIGAKLAGIFGALIAVPLVVMIETIIVEYMRLKST